MTNVTCGLTAYCLETGISSDASIHIEYMIIFK